ncbi:MULTISPECIES: hypothetical protein [Streptomyces]|uniref:hypothetical protein n=1 Tax=Streptomyces TaxID=1883 RepID=UPI001783FAFC|nr:MULTISPECIES: hypothetical protein [Streptomyces]MBF4135785.1 hypothetical protein [Streptomyces albidoflavus]
MGIAVVAGVGFILVCIIIGTTLALVCLAKKSQGGDALTDQIRSIAGMFVVITVVAALLTVSAWGVWASDGNTDKTVTVLTSAFTAATSITTAYLGIRAVSNTAKHAIGKNDPEGNGEDQNQNGQSEATKKIQNEPPGCGLNPFRKKSTKP